ncbi:uncharacterized protein F4822DRAFT_267711 [Hypoxylon trugodes]|uniref:uncharacterized protein n=1 Tax=Hypoxylon trugodes TaxID=326681 RepID=UPI00218E96D8|nr:uncharacterized protein F4822DRAFT_267711 [Hypoxylon trugodes]KAI1389040.1 hypothetical protein F4822DRAFT_267711 [Hypoxylon trugodes]
MASDMSLAANNLACDVVEGNPDLYGIGIRIGVYLQWITAWINLLVDPLSAQSVYDVNSVFVFAILVATMIASFTTDSPIQPIETHIMLQITLGFFITTLSTFGFRLYFLQPASIAESKEQVRGVLEALAAAGQIILTPGGIIRLVTGKLTFPLHLFAPLKPSHLSWSGVFWRTLTVVMLAAVNIWLWFASEPNYRLTGQNCDPPFIFLFSRQQLTGHVVGFCKAVSILIAVVVVPPFWILLQLTKRLIYHSFMALYRDLLYMVAPEAPERLRTSMERINSFLDRNTIPLARVPRRIFVAGTALNTPALQFRGALDLIEFMSKPKEETIRFSDILKIMVYLGRGRVEEHRITSTETESKELPSKKKVPDYEDYWFCFLWNVVVVFAIVWFILSIEFTLLWNNVEGINSIASTGQLIPLVIGCVSTGQVIKKVILLGLAKKYDDWADMTVDVTTDFVGKQETLKIRNTKTTLGDEAR